MKEPAPIVVKTEAFLLWLLQHTAKFPKHERFRLAKRMDDSGFAIHEALLQALYSRQKQVELSQADHELDKLRAYFRLALEAQYTSVKQYEYAGQELGEIGKMIGGWRKAIGYNQE